MPTLFKSLDAVYASVRAECLLVAADICASILNNYKMQNKCLQINVRYDIIIISGNILTEEGKLQMYSKV